MHVDQSQAPALQPVALDEFEHFVIRRPINRGQRLEKFQGLGSIAEVAAGELADNERVTQRFCLAQQDGQPRFSSP